MKSSRQLLKQYRAEVEKYLEYLRAADDEVLSDETKSEIELSEKRLAEIDQTLTESSGPTAEPGRCPKCGTFAIRYPANIPSSLEEDGTRTYRASCQSCGLAFAECYIEVYSGYRLYRGDKFSFHTEPIPSHISVSEFDNWLDYKILEAKTGKKPDVKDRTLYIEVTDQGLGKLADKVKDIPECIQEMK
jgi:hypothetical protein